MSDTYIYEFKEIKEWEPGALVQRGLENKLLEREG